MGKKNQITLPDNHFGAGIHAAKWGWTPIYFLHKAEPCFVKGAELRAAKQKFLKVTYNFPGANFIW